MPDETPQAAEYTMGYSEEFLRLLHQRSAQTPRRTPPPAPQARTSIAGLRLRPRHHHGGPGAGGGTRRGPRHRHGGVADSHGPGRGRGGRAPQRGVPRRQCDGDPLRGLLLRRRPLPYPADARARYPGRARGGEAGPEAGRDCLQPRADWRVLVPGAQLRERRRVGVRSRGLSLPTAAIPRWARS